MKLRYILSAAVAALTLAVGCQKEVDTQLSEVQVSSSYVGIDGKGGSTKITVNAIGNWTIDVPEDASWLTVTPTSGSAGETVVTFSDPDAAAGTYETTVVLTCGGKSVSINVIQMGTKSETKISTVAEVNDGAESVTYRVKGTVTKISETATNGNFYLNDGTVEDPGLYIYGTKYEGQTKQAALEKLGVKVGDIITVEGPKSVYNGTVELVDVDVIDLEKFLIKIPTAEYTVVIDGDELVIEYECDGDGISVIVPEDAKDWLTLKGIDTAAKTVTFEVAANEGGPRSTTITFQTSQDGKEYSAQTAVSQQGESATVAKIFEKGAGIYSLDRLVVMANANGNVIVGDETGVIMLYSSGCTLEAGDVISIDAQEVTERSMTAADGSKYNILQFNGAKYTVLDETATPDYGEAVDILGDEAVAAWEGEPQYQYIRFKGTMGDDNLTVKCGDYGIYIVKSEGFAGKPVIVYGYTNGKMSSYNTITTTLVSIEEDTNAAVFTVSETALNAECTDTEASFDITANVPWTVTCPQGVTAEPASGDADATVKLTFAANESTTPVEYTIVVATTSTEVATDEYSVKLTQEGTEEVVYANLGELNKAILGGVTEFKCTLTDAAEISLMCSDNKSIYLQDATGAILIYSSDVYTALSGSGAMQGLGISGTFTGVATLYNGLPEVTSIDISEASKAWAGKYPCKNLTLAELIADPDSYMNMKVKIDGVEVTDAWSGSDKSGKISQNGSELAVYVKNTGISDVAVLGSKGNLCGYVGVSKSTYEIFAWEDGKWVETEAAPESEEEEETTAADLTIEATGLPTAYEDAASEVTLNGVKCEIYKVANYGNGIQLQGGKTSYVKTAEDLAKNIKTIKLTVADGKSWYPSNLTLTAGEDTISATSDSTSSTYDLSGKEYKGFTLTNTSTYGVYIGKIEIWYAE